MSILRSSIGESARRRYRLPPVTTIIALAALFVIAPGGCTPRQHADSYPSAIERLAIRRQRPDPLVESQTRGRQEYEHYCQICHGQEGQGNGFNAAMLDPPPRNFADEAFWKQADDERLHAVVSRGGKAVGKSVLMPAWGKTLTQTQIHDVVAYLRTVPKLISQQQAEPDAETQ